MIDWQSKVIAPCVAQFGQPATYTQAGAGYALTGVFDEAYSFIDNSGGMPVNSTAPCFGFNIADLPVQAQQRDRLTIGSSGVTYVVRNVQFDGHGWCRLKLNLAPVTGDIPGFPVQDA